MNTRLSESDDPRTAAEWFALRRGAPDADVERRFSTWLAASAENFESYALCELTWELTASAASGLEIPRRARPWYRRKVAWAIAAACALLTISVSIIQLIGPRATVWSTAPGQQLALALSDGSHITLNTRSIVEVRMGRGTRNVRVVQGEAFFDVAHDRSRPFIVETPLGTVRAIGTRFDVLLDEQRVEVNMEEGRVLVANSGNVGQPVVVVAGMRATLASHATRPALDSADLNRIENWRAHRIEFDRVPLTTALREFSRYTLLPIRVGSQRTGRLEISAVVQTGDLGALESMLKGAFGLRVVHQKDELVVVE